MSINAKSLPEAALREVIEWRPIETAPHDVRLIVCFNELPFSGLFLGSTVAWLGSLDGCWNDERNGDEIHPTHWRYSMSLEEAIALGRTDTEANWDTPARRQAHMIRSEASALSKADATS